MEAEVCQYGLAHWQQLVFATLFSYSIKCLASLGPYSGHNDPPKYGDYEAQRHWMEITTNLNSSQWYVHGENNDLLYWGLDYPPLTAYHSYAMGKLAGRINSSWVELNKSRGLQSAQHKLFMRSTVLLSDLVFFFTPSLLYVTSRRMDNVEKVLFLLLFTLYPGYILVDFCHFQYNCVSLGLFLWSICMFEAHKDLLGAVFFVCALNYKQMELYHAPAIFFFLLGKCFKAKLRWRGIVKFSSLSFVVIATFAVIWWPFLGSLNSSAAVLRRLFPVERGLYEDKVGNFWCVSSVLFKWNRLFGVQWQFAICALCTLVTSLPSCLKLLFNPQLEALYQSLVVTSLSFFMFSFHVHEKSILLVAAPALLYYPYSPRACIAFLLSSVFSLFPLCIKDQTTIAFLAVALLYVTIVFDTYNSYPIGPFHLHDAASLLVVVVGSCLCIASMFNSPVDHLPHLFPLLMAAFSFAAFFVFFLYIAFERKTPTTIELDKRQKHD